MVLLLLLVALLLPAGTNAQESDAPAVAPPAARLPPHYSSRLTPHDQARYRTLISELRCLVCQNQSIADSDAPLAADLRAQVETQLAAGRSDAEIQRYLTDRYGDFVLYRPPFKPSTWLLWAGPFVLLLLAIGVAVRFARSRRTLVVATSDPQRVQQLLDDEDRR